MQKSLLFLRIFLICFASGLFLPITGSLITAYLWSYGVDKSTIGVFTLLTLPYSIKFLWSPIIDIYNSKGRKFWIIGCQVLSICFIIFLGLSHTVYSIACCAFFISFLSATQDIAIDALRIESFSEKDQGDGVFLSTFGYRVGMLFGGIVPMNIAYYYGWFLGYCSIIIALLPAMIAVFFHQEKPRELNRHKPSSLRNSIMKDVKLFLEIPGVIVIILLVMTYKLGDAYLGNMTTVFLLDHQFSMTQIANVVKVCGFIFTLMGIFIGGKIFRYLSIKRALYMGLMLQTFSNLLFLLICAFGNNVYILVLVLSIESLAGGIGTAIYVSYISNICCKEFIASQYAIFSSISSIPRIIFASSAGYAASYFGWQGFIVFSFFLSFPALVVLYFLKSENISLNLLRK